MADANKLITFGELDDHENGLVDPLNRQKIMTLGDLINYQNSCPYGTEGMNGDLKDRTSSSVDPNKCLKNSDVYSVYSNYDVQFVNLSQVDLGIDISEDGNFITSFNSDTDLGWNFGAKYDLSYKRTSGHTYSISPDTTIWETGYPKDVIHSTSFTGERVWANFKGSTNKHYLYDGQQPFTFSTNEGCGPYIIEFNSDF